MSNVQWQNALMPDIGGNAFASFQAGQKAGIEDKGNAAMSAYAGNPNQQNLNALLPYQPDFVLQTRQREAKEQADAAERKLVGDALTGDPEARRQVAYTNSDLYLKLDERDRKRVDQSMQAVGQLAYGILDLPKEEQEPALQAALKSLEAQGYDVSTFHLTGDPDVDLRTALAITGQLDDYEKQTVWRADVQADNARQDRNTDSMISDRQQRRQETRRWHDQTEAHRKRGQGGGKRSQPGKVPTATNAQGEKVQLISGKWVPVQ